MYLAELESRRDDPISVGIVGVGRMGRGIADQISTMTGMRVRAAADIDTERAVKAFVENGWEREKVNTTDAIDEAEDALRRGHCVATADPLLIPQLNGVDALVESTGVPEVGAEVADASIAHGTHTVMLNVEADVVVGSALAARARANDVVYTLATGDQPGAIFELVEWARVLGFEIVCAGRGTVFFPDDHQATPETYMESALKGGMNPKMYCEFRDGTKAQCESVAVSNVLQLPPAKRGMHEPFSTWQDLGKVFSLRQDGGILEQTGVVDMANAVDESGEYVHEDKVFPGIFAVVTSPHAGVRSAMAALFEPGFGGNPRQEGPNWGLFRPYHLPCVEVPMAIARAVIQRRPVGDLRGGPVAELVTAAKRDLESGDELDGGGGYTVYGVSERYEVAQTERLLPFGFAYSGRVTRRIARGELLHWDDVEIDTTSFLYRLRQEQDALYGLADAGATTSEVGR